MIRGIILYYLNIKPTHGYEIQQFISLSGINQWTKIQSGSIYYALTKLEKEKNIAVQREERTGSRVRKIYEITDMGRKTLVEEMSQELDTPLFNIGSPKFITDPILSIIPKEKIIEIVNNHIVGLKKSKEYWEYWKEQKTSNDKYSLIEKSFNMSIDSLVQQIEWHEELLAHLDYYIEESKQMSMMIKVFDSDSINEKEQETQRDKQLQLLASIKQLIENNPKEAIADLENMIRDLKK